MAQLVAAASEVAPQRLGADSSLHNIKLRCCPFYYCVPVASDLQSQFPQPLPVQQYGRPSRATVYHTQTEFSGAVLELHVSCK